MGRIMALDVGTKTIGVALSDPSGLIAQPLTTLPRRAGKEFDELTRLVAMYDVETIVVGYPKHMNNTIGERVQMAEAVGKHLNKRLSLPVVYWDERLTTQAAERLLIAADMSRRKRKEVVDKLAAQLILQNYLDAQRAQGGMNMAHNHDHDHDHEHDHEHEHDALEIDENIIYIADEDGTEKPYEILTQIDDEDSGKQYILVAALDEDEAGDDEDEENVLAFRYEEDEEGLTLYPIETDEEWALVEEAFQTLIEEEEI